MNAVIRRSPSAGVGSLAGLSDGTISGDKIFLGKVTLPN